MKEKSNFNYFVSKAAVIILFVAFIAAAQTPWDGTSDSAWYKADISKDTFFVSNGKELSAMRNLVNGGVTFANKTIILANDIDLDDRNWAAIGNNTNQPLIFAGVFDGNGHSILKLYSNVTASNYAGLFGYVGTNGQIKNLVVNVTDVKVTPVLTTANQAAYAGGLAAYYASTKAIENCVVNISGSVSSNYDGSDMVIAKGYCGGLVGFAAAAITISNSHTTGDVSASIKSETANSYVGGLTGYGQSTINIIYSYATGNISADAQLNSSATSSSTCGSVSGGLVGQAEGNITISNSYAYGDVSAASATNTSVTNLGSISTCGGLVGIAGQAAAVSNCYANGTITAKAVRGINGETPTTNRRGGIFGQHTPSSGIKSSVYYNSAGAPNGNGNGSNDYLLGLDAAQIKKQGSFACWDFNNVWGIVENSAAPFLRQLEVTVVPGQHYIGAQITPEVEVRKKRAGTLLTKTKDYSASYGANKNVAEGGTVTITGAGDYSANENYTVNFQILPKELTVTGATAHNKVYDATTSATVGNAVLVGVVGSDNVVVAAGTFADKNAGSAKPVHVSLTGADAGNYTLVQPQGLIADITPKELTVSGAVAHNKVYDATTSATVENATLVGVVGSDNVVVATGTFADKNAGSAKPVHVALTGADAGNYTLVHPQELTADITKKQIVVTLNPKSYNITVSDNIPDLQNKLTYTGFAAGDTKDVITGSVNISCPYQKGVSGVNSYKISLDGELEAENYDFFYDNGSLWLLVSPATKYLHNLTISPISVPDQIYTGNEIKPSFVVKDGNVTLIEGTHYLLSYLNNVNISDFALVTIEGIPEGGYSGTKAMNFKIIAGNTPIRNKTADGKRGILLNSGVVSQEAKITVKTPEQARINIVIYDNLGNIVFDKRDVKNDAEISWDLTNRTGRNVANGSYLIIAQAKGASGKVYNYSAKVGVKR